MSIKKTLLNALLVLTSLVLLFLFLESIFRIRTAFHKESWAEKQTQFVETLTYPYSYGHVRPHVNIDDLRRFFPSGQKVENPIPIRTNSFGLRMREIQKTKHPSTCRLAVLGDSCSFGWMVREEEAYPRVLETLLNRETTSQVEVLNFGVPGYTSFHGRLQYNLKVKSFTPDVVLIAFGFNDSYAFRFSEAEFYQKLKRYNLVPGLSGFPLFLYDHSLSCRWMINRILSIPKRKMEEELKARASQNIWYPRVNRESYKENIRAMVEDIRHNGGRAVLLNLDLPNSWVDQPLDELHHALDVPLVNIKTLFYQQANETLPRNKEDPVPAGLSPSMLQASHSRPYELQFRVYDANVSTSTQRYVLLNEEHHPWPWQEPLFDDGTHGDEQPNDQVWTTQIGLNDKTIIDYAFLGHRLSDEQPWYENAVKALRFYYTISLEEMKPGDRWISPIHTLGKIPFQDLMIPGDPIHPNKKGHQLIAAHLVPVLQKILP